MVLIMPNVHMSIIDDPITTIHAAIPPSGYSYAILSLLPSSVPGLTDRRAGAIVSGILCDLATAIDVSSREFFEVVLMMSRL
jgi:hypothetical protein